MFASASLYCALILSAPPTVATKFEQVAPVPPKAEEIVRSTERTRAVVLLHGFRPYRSEEAVAMADFRDWQRPNSLLVKTLAKDADVFSFGYSQNVPLDAIVEADGLTQGIARLRKAGYREIVLVGHSAGGLIARQFVEDHPDAGVTKVLQICAPNGGTEAATVETLKSQRPFLDSLTPDTRTKCLKERAGKSIPEKVQFVFILSNIAGETDGLVRCDCQWTPDLQRQGVPVVVIQVVHPMVPRVAKGVEAIATAVRQDQPRWKPERVKEAHKMLFGE